MNWVQRKIYLYNVTFGLYMLDWWERYLFSIYGRGQMSHTSTWDDHYGNGVDDLKILLIVQHLQSGVLPGLD